MNSQVPWYCLLVCLLTIGHSFQQDGTQSNYSSVIDELENRLKQNLVDSLESILSVLHRENLIPVYNRLIPSKNNVSVIRDDFRNLEKLFLQKLSTQLDKCSEKINESFIKLEEDLSEYKENLTFILVTDESMNYTSEFLHEASTGYDGPHPNIWSDSQCADIGNIVQKSLFECMAVCDSQTGCTAINYSVVYNGCTLRQCYYPPVPPPKSVYANFVGYSKKVSEQCTEGFTWRQTCNGCLCLNGQSVCSNKVCSNDTDITITHQSTMPIPTINTAINGSVLFKAAEQGNMTVVNKALESGTNIHWRNWYGSTALHAAAATNNHAVAEVLMAAGADPNEQDGDGETPLYRACCWTRNTVVMRTLIAHGADVNIPSNFNSTPLHSAAYQNYPDTAQMLLRAGANPRAQDMMGSTPSDSARLGGHNDLASMIDNYSNPVTAG